MSEQFSNPEQALIERLRRAPQPELPAEARDMIRVRLLDALDHPPLPAPRPILLRPIVVIVIVLVATALIAGVFFVLSQQNQILLPPTSTTTPSLTASPTITIEPTLTLLPTTAVPLVISSPTLTETPESTSLPEAALSPAPLPTTGISTVIVIQGPVEHIDGNIVTIYGIQVQIAPDDPILSTIAVGDILRIEGNQTGTTQIIIVATTVVVVNVDAGGSSANGNVSPPSSGSGEVWSDDGSCAHPPPDWAPANGWRRRCEGKDKEKDKDNKPGKK